MGAVAIQQMADRVSQLMDEKLAVRGKGLRTKLRRGGRQLPRRVQEAAMSLADAAQRAQHPKLLQLIDMTKIAEDYDICVRHLGAIDAADRRRKVMMGAVSSIAFGLLVFIALVVGFLLWRG
ncbi:MAG: hypothetical protein HC844_15035 [Tabrizicola sp.]|nr:hypothetical protein [Tabrizicola sp.]